MPDQEFEYDVFLSHAGEDTEWCETLAERLRNEGVRVWFDKWYLQPGDNVLAKINDGLAKSRKMIAVWSTNYFRDGKVWTLVESFSQLHGDPLSQDRPIIPLLIEDCTILPTFRNILCIDFRNKPDFDLRFRQLLQALDLPRREFEREPDFEFKEHEFEAAQRGRFAQKKGKRFEDEIAKLYELLGFTVKRDTQLHGFQIDLQIEKRNGGFLTQAIVECKDKRLTADDRNQILAQQNLVQKKLPRFRWIAVSSQSFAADTRTALDEAGIDCTTYAELLHELVPLAHYVESVITEYENEVAKNWRGEDWYIRPHLLTDITYEKQSTLNHFAKWLGSERSNFLVLLGDLGTGKSTLAKFLAYNLGLSFRADPLRHPAPVLIPLKEVRKENTLESMIISHFSKAGLPGINFPRFEHLVRLGKVILLFDAFDEMADRVRWEVTKSNFTELRRAAEQNGKVILTCRTHYFKDRNEQAKLIGVGPRLSEIETDLYRELKQQSGAEVVYLQEFDDAQIKAYLHKARPQTATTDWQKIQNIYNLKELAQRPLLLDMIVKSLPKLEAGQQINAASLYKIYTNIWIEREEAKGRILDKNVKMQLMHELAWRMWHEAKDAIHYRELTPFVEKLVAGKVIELDDDEVEDIAREMQTATFLKRDDTGNFSFVHRSFMEYFLARKIYNAIVETHNPVLLKDNLNTRLLDLKIIYFLTLLDETDAICVLLQQILTTIYAPKVSENALQILYWSWRFRHGIEDEINEPDQLRDSIFGRIPSNAQLRSADLQGIILEAADLTGIDFSNANLAYANLNHTYLPNANFNKASLRNARLENIVAISVDFREADLQGVSLAKSMFEECDFSDAKYILSVFVSSKIIQCHGLGRLSRKDKAKLKTIDQVNLDSRTKLYSSAYRKQLKAFDWEEILSRAKHGDEIALTDLCIYVHKVSKIYYFQSMREMGYTVDEFAHEIASMVLSRLPDIRHLPSWIRLAARHRSVDILRDHKRRATISLNELTESDSDALLTDESSCESRIFADLEIDIMIKRLPEIKKQILLMRYIHGLDYPGIAKIFGRSPTTIRKYISQAISQIRTVFEISILKKAESPELESKYDQVEDGFDPLYF